MHSSFVWLSARFHAAYAKKRAAGYRRGRAESPGCSRRQRATHLDDEAGALRDLLRPLQRVVEVGAVDEVEAAELLLRVGERAVGQERPAAASPNDLCL